MQRLRMASLVVVFYLIKSILLKSYFRSSLDSNAVFKGCGTADNSEGWVYATIEDDGHSTKRISVMIQACADQHTQCL